MAIATRAGELVADQYLEVRIVAPDRVVSDSGRAGMLRHQFLDDLEARYDLERYPVLINLNDLHVLTPDAADELIVRWLERVRTPRWPVIAGIATYSRGIANAIDWALRDAKQSAYLVRSAPFGEVPRPVGEVTDTHLATIEQVRRQEHGRATAKEISELMHLSHTAAANRLTELVGRGLLQRRPQLGKVGDQFTYPWPAVTGTHFVPYDAHAEVPSRRNGNRKAARSNGHPKQEPVRPGVAELA